MEEPQRYYVDSFEVDGHIGWMVKDRECVSHQEPDYKLPGRFATGTRPLIDVHDTVCTGLDRATALFICARLNA